MFVFPLVPEGVPKPSISDVTQSSFSLRWSAPTNHNGIIRHYYVSIFSRTTTKEIRVDKNVFTYTITGLDSYVEYSALIKACNDGGCGSSAIAKVRTLTSPPKSQPAPSAEATGNSSLRVRWAEPNAPNGPIQRYQLQHRTIESLLTESITKPTPWTVVYSGTATVFDHLNLGVYSQQQYFVSCV